MRIKICFFLLLYISFCPLFIYSQKVEIIKDTVCFSSECFEIQELEIHKPLIYNKIQKTYNLFDNNEVFTDYKMRLNHKKKNIKDCKSIDDLREIQYGFEDYEIYFNKNNLLNISIALQVYGSSYEDIKFYTFDIKKDKELGIKLFKNKKELFNKCLKKLTEINSTEIPVKYNSLSEYKIITEKKRDISNLVFVFVNPANRSESYEIVFSFSEIKPFLNSKYLKYFKQ